MASTLAVATLSLFTSLGGCLPTNHDARINALRAARPEFVFEAVMLPMRDGVELHTLVITPLSGTNFTTVYDTSPYGEDGIELIAEIFLPLGYAAVTQVRRIGDDGAR
mgnify:FL=1